MAVDPLAPSPAPGAYTNNTARLKINEIASAVNSIELDVANNASDIQAVYRRTGWGSYVDGVHISAGTAFTALAGVDTALPNNKATVNESQKPSHVTTFYDGTVITGRNGDNLDIMIYFKAIPTNVSQSIDIWIDIGGAVGELYRQTYSFPKGSGVERGIMYPLPSAYTLGTWEANGGTIYINSSHDVDIFDINYNFDLSHKAV